MENEFIVDKMLTSDETFAVQSDVIVWRTTDYSKFKLSNFNRNPSHYKNVKESINKNDYAKYQPILVNKNMEIVDGQNRFLACQELGLPIYFIGGMNVHIYAAADINKASKNWSSLDYARHYAQRGKEEYIKLLDLCYKYNQRLSIVQQFGIISNRSRSHTENVKSGDFKFREDVDIDDFFEHMKVFEDYYRFAKKDRFVKSVLHLYLNENYNKKKMKNKLRLASAIVKEQPRVDLMTDELLKLYNYKSKNKIILK